MKTLIIIPAYNEANNIKDVVDSVVKENYDYLVINDCSKDETGDILNTNKFNHLDLPVNLGIAGVTRAGFMYALKHNYDYVVCIDGDGQHQPKYIKDLIQELENGNDYVVGSRFVCEKKPLTLRMLGSRLICLFIKLKTGETVTDPTSGMRGLNKRVIKEFCDSMNFVAEPDALAYLLHKKYKVKEVQAIMKERQGGQSYFHNPFKSIYYMLSVMLSILLIQ